MASTHPPTIEQVIDDADALSEIRDRDFDFHGDRSPIPAAYQGIEFHHAKELTKDMQVIDTHYGSPRVCTVIRTYKMSVRLRHVYANGMVSEYGCPIHHLRRLG